MHDWTWFITKSCFMFTWSSTLALRKEVLHTNKNKATACRQNFKQAWNTLSKELSNDNKTSLIVVKQASARLNINMHKELPASPSSWHHPAGDLAPQTSAPASPSGLARWAEGSWSAPRPVSGWSTSNACPLCPARWCALCVSSPQSQKSAQTQKTCREKTFRFGVLIKRV